MQSIFFFRLSSFSSPSTLVLSLRATILPSLPLCFLKDVGLPRWECGRVSNFWQVVLQGSLLFLSRRRTRTRIYIHIPLPPPRSPPSHPADLASLSRTRPACTAITIYFVYGRALKRVESLYTFGRFGFCLHADLPAIFGILKNDPKSRSVNIFPVAGFCPKQYKNKYLPAKAPPRQ